MIRNTRDIRRKINSIKNTQKITQAMKMVAAVKLRKAQNSMNAVKPYANKIKELVLDVYKHITDENIHPFLSGNESNNIGVLLVTSDRGLCGAFNSNVIKKFFNFVSDNKNTSLKVITVGKAGFNALKRRNITISKSYINLVGNIKYDDAISIGDIVTDFFMKQEIGSFYIIYNEFKNAVIQVPTILKLLPVKLEDKNGSTTKSEILWGKNDESIDFIYEPAPKELLSKLLPKYLNFLIYSKLLESLAGEHGSRMTAMDNATRNATDLIEQLTLNYNKIRQSSITMELLDIVNCAEALS